ncbi:MAG: hypothetical protein ABIK43_05090, partial [candidate division WOR-3 bacterium]
MARKSFLSLILLCLGSPASAQSQYWIREYGIRARADFAMGGAIELPDAGFVICGSTFPMYFPLWNIDGYVVRVNAYGDTVWTRRLGDSLGGNPKDYIWDAILNSTGELVLAGTRFVPWTGEGAQGWFLRLNLEGSISVDRRLGGNDEENFNEIIQNPDGTYLLLGDTRSFGTQRGGKDVWLVKLNPDGETIWTRTYDLNYEDMGTGIIPFQENNYLITTFSKTGELTVPPADIGFAAYLLIDSIGETLRVVRFREDSLTSFACVAPTRDQGAIITGQRSATDNFPSRDIWLLKLNRNGDTVWTRTYGARGRYDGGTAVFESERGGYYLAAYSQTYTPPGMGYDNWWLLRLNASGDTLWTRWWGGPLNDDPSAVLPTADGGLLIAGWKDANSWDSLTLGDAQFWAIKTDSLGIVPGIASPSAETGSRLLELYPNPAGAKLLVSFTVPCAGRVSLKLFDAAGREAAVLLAGYLNPG